MGKKKLTDNKLGKSKFKYNKSVTAFQCWIKFKLK